MVNRGRHITLPLLELLKKKGELFLFMLMHYNSTKQTHTFRLRPTLKTSLIPDAFKKALLFLLPILIALHQVNYRNN